MTSANAAAVERFVGEGKLTRIQLFLDRDQALEAAGLTPDYDKEKA